MAFMFVFISNILKVILLLYIFLFSFFLNENVSVLHQHEDSYNSKGRNV